MSGKLTFGVLLLALILLISIPYLVGFQASDADLRFGGFLMNPRDGNSYLAKMQQGYQGSWKFQLPYTAERGEGAYLFLFYIALGHFARLTGLSLLVVFHGARLAAAVWLLVLIWRLLRGIFAEEKFILTGFALAIFGSGLGWLAILAGLFTSDFWVAEAYPFLSMYTNPHFSLGLGLMIYSVLPRTEESWLGGLAAAVVLALVQPFGVVIICLVKLIRGMIKIRNQDISLKDSLFYRWVWAAIIFCGAGGSLLLYQFGVIKLDPILSQWHAQNITARPETGDLLISLMPCLVLGLIGFRKAWQTEMGKTMVVWGAICLALVFIPWSLQRRFLTGIYFPLTILSVFGLMALQEKTNIDFRYWVIGLFFLAIPTNLIVISSGIQAISERNPQIFLKSGLADCLEWINEYAETDELVLTDPDSGLYVPAWTGRRVVYGHPFETINASAELVYLEGIFLADQQVGEYGEIIAEGSYKLVLIEQEGSGSFIDWLEENWQLAFQSAGYQIYRIR